MVERERKRLRKLIEYSHAIKQNNFYFISDLQNESLSELENMASILNALYRSGITNRDFPSGAPLDEQIEIVQIINTDKYESPTEKLLDFVLQLRVQKKDARFKFNQENIDKIIRLDRQLQDIFDKSKKEADSEIYRLKEKMQKDNDMDSISVEIELTNIVFSENKKSIFYDRTHDLFSSNPFFTVEHNIPLWKTIYYKTDEYKSTEKSLAECWNKIPFFDLSTQHNISNHFTVKFTTDENNRNWVERIYADSAKCIVGNPFIYIYEQGCYTLSEMLDIKEIWININNIRFKFKIYT